MAEHPEPEAKIIGEIFIQGYNTLNSTNYQWIDGKSNQPGEPYDVKFFDKNQELGVQLVRAVENEERDFIRPKYAGLVMKKLIKTFEDKQIKGIHVYLNFENQPRREEEIDRLVYWLDYFILHKAMNRSSKVSYFSYNRDFDDQFLAKLTPYISELDILPSEPDSKCFFAWSYHKREPEPLLDDEQQITGAVVKKQNKYTDVILVVDARSPIHEYYIPLIEQKLKSEQTKEVWVVENFISPGARAIKVK